MKTFSLSERKYQWDITHENSLVSKCQHVLFSLIVTEDILTWEIKM